MIFIKIFFNHTDVWRLDLFIEEKKPWLVRWYYSQLVIVSSLLLLLTCTHSDVCIYIYINIFSFVGEWFAECCCINVDKCSGYSCRTTQHLINKAWITTILLNLYYLLYYSTILYYIFLEKALWERLMAEVVAASKVCFSPLIYIFFRGYVVVKDR